MNESFFTLFLHTSLATVYLVKVSLTLLFQYFLVYRAWIGEVVIQRTLCF